MRRRAPRPLSAALGGFLGEASPGTVLGRVQACWGDVVGSALAAQAEPVSERDGILTVACRSGTWANELELLAPALLEKLNRALGDAGEGPLTRLRAKAGGPP